jgi:DNA modification methylase
MNIWHEDDIPADLRHLFQPAPQIGLEETPDAYVEKLVAVFREVRRVLRDDGTLWLNLGDSYSGGGPHHGEKNTGISGSNRGSITGADRRPVGFKLKDLIGIPWLVAFALRADGWYLRSDIIWHKPNPMPESVTDRPTKAHEYVFMLSKSARYFYNDDAIRDPLAECTLGRLKYARTEASKWKAIQTGASDMRSTDGARANLDGRNARSVWTIATQAYPEAHFATFPEALAERCILAGCPAGGVVLDPFCGTATALLEANRHGCRGVGIELNPAYLALAVKRLSAEVAQGKLALEAR